MNFYKYYKQIFVFFIVIAFFSILSILIFNIDRGFDITDESYYILTALHQNDLYSVITHEGYYTGVLFFLSGYNLSIFRLFGILILLLSSLFFVLELIKYIQYKLEVTVDSYNKLVFIFVVLTSSLSYYRIWILTPSYNWLALISVILVFASLFRIINNSCSYNSFKMAPLLLSLSLSLSFMAKPTSTIFLILILVIFAIFEYKKLNLKKLIPIVFLLTSFIILLHIFLFDEGIQQYLYKLKESINLMNILGSGHTLNSRFSAMMSSLNSYFFEEFYFFNLNVVYFIILIMTFLIIYKESKYIKVYDIYLYLCVFILCVFILFKYGIVNDYRLIWFRMTEILLLSIIIFIFIGVQHGKSAVVKKIFLIFPIIIVLNLGSFAYKFGTNSHIIHDMSESLLFLSSSIMIIHLLIDKIYNTKLFSFTGSFIIMIFVYFLIENAYNKPYRLATSISEQNQYINFFGGLHVDQESRKYIIDLQSIQFFNNTRVGLIDMTGGTPGANLILNADIFGHQWLIGGYSGSNEFVAKILNRYRSTKKLKSAWILISPNGSRKINLDLLKVAGLEFPKNYEKVITIKTAYRNEYQELWKPLDIE